MHAIIVFGGAQRNVCFFLFVGRRRKEHGDNPLASVTDAHVAIERPEEDFRWYPIHRTNRNKLVTTDRSAAQFPKESVNPILVAITGEAKLFPFHFHTFPSAMACWTSTIIRW